MDGKSTIAGRVVDAIIPFRNRVTEETPNPLPMSRLGALASDESMLYGMGRVDNSGRISDSSITRALGWSVGDLLDATFLASALVLSVAPESGWIPMSGKSYITLPTSARARGGIHVGDRVLLAAAIDKGVLIVHTASALDEMMIQFHGKKPKGKE